jgi:hypothetical protein
VVCLRYLGIILIVEELGIGYQMNDQRVWVRFSAVVRNFLYSIVSRLDLGPPILLFNSIGGSFPGGKAVGA